jgi:hypothetical protein
MVQWGLVTRLSSRLRDLRNATAAVLAGNSLAWRLLPDAAGRRLAGRLDVALDGLVGSLVGATVTVTLADLRLLGIAFDAALYLYLVAGFLPRFLPEGDPAGPVFGSRRFAYAASLAVLCLGFPLSMLVPVPFAPSSLAVLSAATGLSLGEPTATQLLGVLFGWSVLVAGGLGTYVYLVWWRDATVRDRVRFFDQLVATRIDREEVVRNLSRDDWVGSGTGFFALFGSVGVLVVVFAFFAVLSGFAIVLFPLPELVLLTAVAVSAGTRLVPGDRRVRLAAGRVDVEERFFRVFRFVRTSRKGAVAVPYLVVGLLISMLLTLISNAGVVVIGYAVLVRQDELARVALGAPLRTWAGFAVLACVLVPGLYSLWFWFRQVGRLPRYLAHWERTHPGGAPLESATDLPPAPTRPLGNLLPPSLLFVPFVAVATLLDGEASPAAIVALAVGAPALLAVVGWTVYRTRQAPPQHPRTDGRAIPLAFLIQLGWLWVFLGGELIPDAGTAIGLTPLGFIAAATSLIYVVPEVDCYLEATGAVEYTTAALTAVIGVATLSFAAIWAAVGPAATGLARVLAAAGGLFLALAALAAAARWTIEREE